MIHSNMQSPSGVSLSEIETAMIQMAEIVSSHPQYLCLYARLEREFIMMQEGQSILERALSLAKTRDNPRYIT